MSSIYAKTERLKYFAKLLLEKYEVKCYFCGEAIDGLDFYARKSGKERDDITVHHLDENRNNNVASNLVFSHRKCHLKHHRQKEKAEHERKYQEVVRKIREKELKEIEFEDCWCGEEESEAS
jgi:hypothetical protein